MSHLINHACNQCGPGRIWSCGTCGCHNSEYNHLCRNCGSTPSLPGYLPSSFPQHAPNWAHPGYAPPFVEGFVRQPAPTPLSAPVLAPSPVSGVSVAHRQHGESRRSRHKRKKQREERGSRSERRGERMRSGKHRRRNKAKEVSSEELLSQTGNARPADIANMDNARGILQTRLANADAAVEAGKKRLEEAQGVAAALRLRLSSEFIPRDVVAAILEGEQDLI